jgi:MFS family permease
MLDRRLLLIYGGVFSIMGLSNSIVPILDMLSESVVMSSILFSAYFGGAMVSLLPFGMLSDRYGYMRIILFSIVLSFISGVGISFFDDPTILVLMRVLEGIGCGAFFPPALSLVSMLPRNRMRVGQFNFMINFGLVMGMVAGGGLSLLVLKGSVYVFTFLLAILCLAGLRTTDEPHKISYDVGSDFERAKTLTPISLVCFVLFGFTGVVLAFYPFYAELSKLYLGIALGSVYLGAMVFSEVAWRVPIRNITVVGIITTALGTFLSAYTPLGLFIMGGGSGLAFVGIVCDVSQLIERSRINRGFAMGILNTAIYAGFSIVPPLLGLFSRVLSINEMFIISSIVIVLSIALRRNT